MKALLLAAGKGERLRPQTLQLAKPALPLLNVPMLAYSTFYLELLGAKEYLINTHHLPATVEDAARQVLPRKASLKFSFETEILGSGGGLAQALRMSGATTGPILIANADAILLLPEPEKIQELLQTHVASGALATLLVCPFPPAAETFGGVYVDKTFAVKKFSKTKVNDSSLTPWHFTGFMIVDASLLEGLAEAPSNLLYDILQSRIDRGSLVRAVNVSGGSWYETGNLKDYLSTTASLLSILAGDSPLKFTLIKILDRFSPGWWKGWRLPDKKCGALLASLPWPDRVQVEDFAVIGPEAIVGEGVTLKRTVITGPAVIDPGKTLQSLFVVGAAK